MMEEQRQSRRFAPLTGTEEGLLRIKGHDHKVFLEDVSSGGFGVAAELNCSVLTGEEALFEDNSGWHKVRIIHIEDKNAHRMIGLQRMGEITEKEVTIASLSWFGRVSPWHRSGGSFVSPGKALVGLVLLGLICGLLYWSSTLGGQGSAVISNPF